MLFLSPWIVVGLFLFWVSSLELKPGGFLGDHSDLSTVKHFAEEFLTFTQFFRYKFQFEAWLDPPVFLFHSFRSDVSFASIFLPSTCCVILLTFNCD